MAGGSGQFAALEYRSLEHWRGVAALGVVLFHGFGAIRGADTAVHPLVSPFLYVSGFGWFGVHLFFVISGYCIAANVCRLSRQQVGAGGFLQDRLLRIYPLYWIACLIALAVGLLAMPFNGVPLRSVLPRDWTEAIAAVLLIEPYLGINGLLLVSWSLVYELGFYTIFAIGFFVHGRGAPVWLLLVHGLALAIFGILGFQQGMALVLRYWPDFCIGGAVFVAVQLRSRSPMACLIMLAIPFALAALALAAAAETRRPVEIFILALYAIALFVLKFWDDRIADQRRLRWLAWVGTLSYSLYLIHVPVGARVINLALRWVPADSAWFLAVELAYWAVSIGAAYVLYRQCEVRLERWRKDVRRQFWQPAF